MTNFKSLGLAVSLSALVFSSSAMAEDKMVEGYVVDSTGKEVTSTYDGCVRTTIKNAAIKPGECGYPVPVTKKMEIVRTPTAVSVTAKVDEEVVIAAAILFEFDSDVLSDDGKLVIAERIGRFSDYKKSDVEVQVIGHTDSTGPEAYNQKLSERRANSVGDFIERMKQSPDANVETSGMGESQPIASNDTKEGRATNRRVKIIATGTVTK